MRVVLFIFVSVYWSLEPRAYGADVDALSIRGSIYFEESDITVSINNPNGDKIVEAFNATSGVEDPRKMRWVSLGVPRLLIRMDQINNTQKPALKFVSGGFHIFIKTLSSEVAQELAKEASQKYASNISISQFIAMDKHIGSVECSLDLFVDDTVGFIKLNGSAVVIANPIVVFFKLPIPINTYVKIIRNETNPLIFRCNIELHGRSRMLSSVRLPELKNSTSLVEYIGTRANISGNRLLNMGSDAENISDVFTEQISLSTEDFYIRENDIINECIAAVQQQQEINKFDEIYNSTANIRDSMNETITAIKRSEAINSPSRINCALAMSTRDDYLKTMLQGTNLSICSELSISGAHSFVLFTKNSTFTVPPGINSVWALAVGGGAGGGSGYGGGGGSGFVRARQLSVTQLTQIKVTVRRGGPGSTMKMNNTNQNGGCGGRSTFGNLTAEGGRTPNISSGQYSGGNGGSGGGAPWYSTSSGSSSGRGGTNGMDGTGSTQSRGGTGQGNFTALFQSFTQNKFTAGNGGIDVAGAYMGGGGGGGVLINGDGPSGGRGQFGDTFGGNGYGAGGAGGKYDPRNSVYYAGGDGAGGFVYIEW